MYLFFGVGSSAWIIIRVKTLYQDQSGSTTADIYSFGNKSAPRGARPQQDFNVENFDSIVGLMSLMSYTNHYHGNTEEKNDKYV